MSLGCLQAHNSSMCLRTVSYFFLSVPHVIQTALDDGFPH